MAISAGKRDRLVTVERKTVTEDAFGGEIETWLQLTRGWASVSFGTGQERREAAKESASATATFRFDWTTRIASVTALDRLSFMGAIWDISSAVPFGRNEGIDITAMRAA